MKTLKQQRLEKIRKMYEDGVSVSQMASELGCAISTASEYLKELGIKQERTAKLTEQIKKKYKAGKKIKHISAELNVSETFVRTTLKKWGLNKRLFFCSEENLIDENTKFAEDRLANLVLEKVLIDGKMYEDITPIFSPR